MGDTKTADGQLGVLVHNEGDAVGVAIAEVPVGMTAARWLDSGRQEEVPISETIPLGHKVALIDLEAGSQVIEYGVRIAVTRRAIARGELVHTHNVRSARWQQSA